MGMVRSTCSTCPDWTPLGRALPPAEPVSPPICPGPSRSPTANGPPPGAPSGRSGAPANRRLRGMSRDVRPLAAPVAPVDATRSQPQLELRDGREAHGMQRAEELAGTLLLAMGPAQLGPVCITPATARRIQLAAGSVEGEKPGSLCIDEDADIPVQQVPANVVQVAVAARGVDFGGQVTTALGPAALAGQTALPGPGGAPRPARGMARTDSPSPGAGSTPMRHAGRGSVRVPLHGLAASVAPPASGRQGISNLANTARPGSEKAILTNSSARSRRLAVLMTARVARAGP